MKRNLWYLIHNAIAHPLLCSGTMWAERFHDYSFEQLERHSKPVQEPAPSLSIEEANAQFYRHVGMLMLGMATFDWVCNDIPGARHYSILFALFLLLSRSYQKQ